ncbi:hypothetical protein NECAME_17409 [Necator americanus]|uniref:Peptidase M1 membrane alanine aminopeptidase domain-containing protein n=1 Tax=Necator americanus TaxID=51031 RepID=W2TPK5_NECAM|nr:hypothetical protein NECAME_17409 [Necator americanus]ETN83614.1 hypothetical protein NECAME_17409 [Necator americanus]
MKWWDDVWLNEGFATYAEHFGADVISDNNMRMQEIFIIDSLKTGMALDSVAASHPLSFKIDKASEVFEAFDSISYGKGASVLRMISHLIGVDNYNNAIAVSFLYPLKKKDLKPEEFSSKKKTKGTKKSGEKSSP